MPTTIETATPEDLPALSGLLTRLFAQEAEFTPDDAAQTRGLAMILANPEVGTLFVLRDADGTAVGMVSLLYTVSTALGARVALVEDMVLAPSHRGRGEGSALLAHAIAHAEAAGCQRLTLLTDATNTTAQRFYARHGFERSTMVPMRRASSKRPQGL